MSIPTGAMPALPAPWAAPIGRCANGGNGAGPDRPSRKRPDGARPAFSPSAVRARVTALACTLPRDSGKPLSRWSAAELARAVIQRRIVRRISASTIRRWLQADRIKPWQYQSWQRPTDPRFLERAIPILKLYERAQLLARQGQIIVCADEKTSIQARKACGRTMPAGSGRAMHVPDRYQRRGAVQLFAGLLGAYRRDARALL
jgi:Homeodomain-like domain